MFEKIPLAGVSIQEWLCADSERCHITWSNVSTVKFDTARIKAESPGLYADYAKQSSYRRF